MAETKHLYKSFEMKADEAGKIAGFFSTYEKTPDSYGDIIEPGAFTKTIEARKATGHPFPLCWNHDFSAVIGAVEVEEKERGPFCSGDFIETQQAQDVRKMVQSGAVYQFSFAYDVLKRRDPTAEETKQGVTNVLQELEVYEISVVTVPANTNAQVTEIKAAEEPETPETKAGRRNSRKDEDTINGAIGQLKSCIDALQSLIDEGAEDTQPEETDAKSAEAEPEVNAAAEEPKDDSNAKRAEAILAKISEMNGGSQK